MSSATGSVCKADSVGSTATGLRRAPRHSAWESPQPTPRRRPAGRRRARVPCWASWKHAPAQAQRERPSRAGPRVTGCGARPGVREAAEQRRPPGLRRVTAGHPAASGGEVGMGPMFCGVQWPSPHGWSHAGPWGARSRLHREPLFQGRLGHAGQPGPRPLMASESMPTDVPGERGRHRVRDKGGDTWPWPGGGGCGRRHAGPQPVPAWPCPGWPPAGHAGHRVPLSAGRVRAQAASLGGSRGSGAPLRPAGGGLRRPCGGAGSPAAHTGWLWRLPELSAASEGGRPRQRCGGGRASGPAAHLAVPAVPVPARPVPVPVPVPSRPRPRPRVPA